MTGRPPDAPRPRPERAEWVWQAMVTAAFLAVILVGCLLAVQAMEALLTPVPPIATPTRPPVVVPAPSPDARLGAAIAAVATNTAVLPTFAAAYVIAQTAASGDALATWAADRQATP